jgi:hypothetical protein
MRTEYAKWQDSLIYCGSRSIRDGTVNDQRDLSGSAEGVAQFNKYVSYSFFSEAWELLIDYLVDKASVWL